MIISFVISGSQLNMAMPYEPPPDYPMLEDGWRADVLKDAAARLERYEAHCFPTAIANIHHPIHANSHRFSRYPGSEIYRQRENFQPIHRLPPNIDPAMLRTRQFPEVAGIYGEDLPALRRFTRYNQSIMSRDQPILIATPPPLCTSSSATKALKKPSFFTGNWTFREKKASNRPTISRHDGFRDDRPISMNLSESSRSSRSKSETSREPVKEKVFTRDEFPRYSEFRVPVRHERTSTPTMRRMTPEREVYKTNITVDDTATTTAVLRPKRENPNLQSDVTNHNYGPLNIRNGLPISAQMRKSCPDLDTTCSASNFEEHRVSKKRNRRAKEKARDAAWKRKRIQEWTLDDVLLWLQSCQLEEVASLLIGYDLRGEDLLYWDHHTLSQLGVTEHSVRTKILDELKAFQNRDPNEEEKKKEHKTLFDIVKQTSYDQVLAVETPLTTRDITVTHGRLGCLQITKVNGANLLLKEQDCLLEINERPGEQFKSALMLTKLISDSNGAPIRFVVLRRKTFDSKDDNSNDTSSGVSSSPHTPSE